MEAKLSGWLETPPDEIKVGSECWFEIPDFDQRIGPYFVTKHDPDSCVITFDRDLDPRIGMNSSLFVADGQTEAT